MWWIIISRHLLGIFSTTYKKVKYYFNDGQNLLSVFIYLVVIIDKIDAFRYALRRLVAPQTKFQL